jgi:hypothetical protein
LRDARYSKIKHIWNMQPVLVAQEPS